MVKSNCITGFSKSTAVPYKSDNFSVKWLIDVPSSDD
jgi:hypothetical protein